jgi:hypothetical protein
LQGVYGEVVSVGTIEMTEKSGATRLSNLVRKLSLGHAGLPVKLEEKESALKVGDKVVGSSFFSSSSAPPNAQLSFLQLLPPVELSLNTASSTPTKPSKSATSSNPSTR